VAHGEPRPLQNRAEQRPALARNRVFRICNPAIERTPASSVGRAVSQPGGV
jgi:hypothetical protein